MRGLAKPTFFISRAARTSRLVSLVSASSCYYLLLSVVRRRRALQQSAMIVLCASNQGVFQLTSPMGDYDSPASSSQWHWQC